MDRLVEHLNNLKVRDRDNQHLFLPHENKTDLNKKSIHELKLMSVQQEKLLTNKKFVSNLPDKGEKLRKLHDEMLSLIKQKESTLHTDSMLDELQSNTHKRFLPSQPTLDIGQEKMHQEEQQEDSIASDRYVSVLSRDLEEKSERQSKEQGTHHFKTNQVAKERKKSEGSSNAMEVESKFEKYLNDGITKHFSPSKPMQTLSLAESLVVSKVAQTKEKEIARVLATQSHLTHAPETKKQIHLLNQLMEDNCSESEDNDDL